MSAPTPVEVAEWIVEHEAAGRPDHDCAAERVGSVCGVCGAAVSVAMTEEDS